MLNQLKDYFSFNKRERNGLFVLISIIAVLIILPFIYPYFVPEEKSDFSRFKKDILTFENSLESTGEYNNDASKTEIDFSNTDRSVTESKLNPFPFDPNNLPEEKWTALGLTAKQIKSIKNYEAKGGKFYKKEDFKKMYCITATEYAILEPYIVIKEIAKTSFKNEYKKTEKNTSIVEINSADTTEFKTLKGIGKYFALKIIAYRKSIGGFCKAEQLLEVKGMDTARYELIKNFVSVNLAYVRKLNVNTASFDELKNHPYIGYNIALSLINYRTVHGNFKVLSDIKNSALITEKVYARISPYLKTE